MTGHQGDINSLAFARGGRTLVSGSTDTTALVWDVVAAAARERGASWDDLLSPDGAKAYRVLCTLGTSPEGVKTIRDRLPPARAADAAQVARLVAALDAEDFEEREKATRELATLGEGAEPLLRKELDGTPSPERRRRLTQLRDNLSSEWLRTRRALEALELGETPEGAEALRALAGGDPDARLTRAAKEALGRAPRRPLQ